MNSINRSLERIHPCNSKISLHEVILIIFPQDTMPPVPGQHQISHHHSESQVFTSSIPDAIPPLFASSAGVDALTGNQTCVICMTTSACAPTLTCVDWHKTRSFKK